MPEGPSQLESKKPIENTTHDLLNLSLEEKETLKKRIEKCAGLVRIFVHPLFEKWRHGENESYKGNKNAKDLIEIEKTLARIMALEEEKTPPLIIMEEEQFMSKLKQWIKSNPPEISKQKVYFVKTLETDPTPGVEKPKNYSSDEVMDSILKMMRDPRNDPAWKALEETLKELGVKKIFLGGMQLKISKYRKDWTFKGPWMGGCIGIAMSHLAKEKGGEFEVELSALTAPFSERRHFADFKRKLLEEIKNKK